MARRKRTTHRKRTHHRRARVRGVSDTLTMVGGLAAGVAVGQVVAGLANKFLPTTMQGGIVPTILAAGVGAFVVPKVIKSPIGKDIAAGAVAAALAPLISPVVAKLKLAGVGYVYRGTPKMQSSVGAPGYVNNAVNGLGAIRDLAAVGTLFDN